MKMPRWSYILPILLLCTTAGFLYTAVNRYHKEIPMSGEKELKVTIDAGMGDFSIARVKDGKHQVFEADVEADLKGDFFEYCDYSTRDHVGYLSINTAEDVHRTQGEKRGDHSFHFSGFDSNRWDVRLNQEIPISFDLQLWLGKGTLDFTGLTVKDLNLSAGASSVDLRFDEPNRSVIEDMTIESGLSRFRGENLNNANFNHLKFEGGVGSYMLDFGGKLTREVDADIEVGLGSLTIVIPENVGVKVTYEKSLIAHLDIDRGFTEQGTNTYFTPNYSSARGKMNLHIEAGVGNVRITREE
jgi:hypothetical protein